MEVFTTIKPDDSVSLFVKNIVTIENLDNGGHHTLSFYADGYPGIMFQETHCGLLVLPQNKSMPDFFLYGQTIHPIQLKITGSYRLIVFQLYPFVVENFFGVQPESLNDDCYNLANVPGHELSSRIEDLKASADLNIRIRLISEFLFSIFQSNKAKLDYVIQKAILVIIKGGGLTPLNNIKKNLSISERTFERRFLKAVGVTPKQFSQIIRFQNSMDDLKSNSYEVLSDIVYKNGFADQSHFTRVFKAFTGATPSHFSNKG